jgi:hypothetical protein
MEGERQIDGKREKDRMTETKILTRGTDRKTKRRRYERE